MNKYSGTNWKVYEYCFIEQKCKHQMGLAQYEDTTIPLGTRGINILIYHTIALSNGVYNLVLGGSKVISHQISNVLFPL